MDLMGKRIKKKREVLGFLVKDLSAQIGVTPSLISQIERGKAFPSIVTLKKIAETLQTTVSELIGENDNLRQHPLLKSNERRFVKANENGTNLHLLSHHEPSKQIEPYIIQFQNKSDSNGIMTSNYPGQDASGEYIHGDVIDWLISCSECGICEQSCPKHLPLTIIFSHIRNQLQS